MTLLSIRLDEGLFPRNHFRPLKGLTGKERGLGIVFPGVNAWAGEKKRVEWLENGKIVDLTMKKKLAHCSK
jgi:hypothetical protein